MDKEKLKKIINEKDVRYVKLQFTDLFGTIKSVEIPASQLDKAFDGKIMFDGSSVQGFVRVKETDMYLQPDLDSFLILPLESNGYGNVARIICDVHLTDGSMFSGDPRVNLKKVLAEARKLGLFDLKIGLEPEFYLLKENEEGEPILKFSDQGSYFDMAPLDRSESCRHDIVLELEKLGFEVEASHHEVGPGQNEINFLFSSAVKACDNVQTFKYIVKQVARKHKLHATFMPKILETIPGNGMHVNCSLTDFNGNNLFYDSNNNKNLSNLCLSWMSGILKHARAISALTNPIVNSYKRLISGYEAPNYICWSEANRSAMIRIPAFTSSEIRTEIRNVDCAANPYLAITAILAAGLDGIRNNYELLEPIYDNIQKLSMDERNKKGIISLPENLKDAIDELKQSKIMKEALGEHIFEKYIYAKELEWEEYRKLIHNWELERYL